MRKYKIPKFKVGDKVAYSVQFLKSLGITTGDMPHGRGTVVAIEDFGSRKLIRIQWNIARLPERVLDANLAIVGANPRFTNID